MSGPSERKPAAGELIDVDPTAVKDKSNAKIEVPAQQYITSSLRTITERLLADLQSEQEKTRFIDFAQRLHSLYAMRFARRTENLRSCFDKFCAETCPTLEEHFGTSLDLQPPHAIKHDEDFFVETLHNTLEEGNYTLLSDSYYKVATSTDFEVGIEMKMDDQDLDSTFIRRMHGRHKEETKFRQAAEVTRKVLIYHRGMGQASTKGMFVLEKLDIVVDGAFHTFTSFLLGLLYSVLGMMNLMALFNTAKKRISVSDDADEEFSPPLPDNEECTTTTRKRYVFRYTLKQALRENWLNLFQPVELLEPTFRELIIVYRMKSDLKSAENLKLVPRVVLKSFTDIPISDFEVVLPAQKPVSRPLDALKIVIAVIGAVLTVRSRLAETREELRGQDPDIMEVLGHLWPTLAVVGGYVSKIMMQYLASQKRYNFIITDYLYKKSLNNNRGLLPFIVDSTLQQEVKEALIGYYFLWTNRAQTYSELDEECEAFLANLEEEVDFEAEDSVRKLMMDDLVRCALPRTKDSQLFHLSISRATQTIQDKISSFHEDKDRECPYCSYLADGDHS